MEFPVLNHRKCRRKLTVTKLYPKHNRMSGSGHSSQVVGDVPRSGRPSASTTDENFESVNKMLLKNKH